MFPIKCPMHYEGCTQFVDGSVAKRILNPLQYEKFVDFADRALYGEGTVFYVHIIYICFDNYCCFYRHEMYLLSQLCLFSCQ